MVPKLCVSRFHLPKSKRSSAADPIDFGQKGLHFIIAIFAPPMILVCVKQNYELKELYDKKDEHLEKKLDRLKFDSYETEIILRPVLKILLNHKEVKKLKNPESLFCTFLTIGLKKAKVVRDIEKGNKIFLQKALNEIYLKHNSGNSIK